MCLSACLPVCAVRPPPGGEPLGFTGLGWRPSDSVLLSVRSLLSQPLCPSTPEARRTAPPFPRACPHTRSGALWADGQEVLAPAAGLSADLGFLGGEGKCLAALVGRAQVVASLSPHWCSGCPSLLAAHPAAGPARGPRRLRVPGGALPVAPVPAHGATGVGFLLALVTEVSEQLVLP